MKRFRPIATSVLFLLVISGILSCARTEHAEQTSNPTCPTAEERTDATDTLDTPTPKFNPTDADTLHFILPDAAQGKSALRTPPTLRSSGMQNRLHLADTDALQTLSQYWTECARRIALERQAALLEMRSDAHKYVLDYLHEQALAEACPGYDAEFIATLTEEEQAEARYFYEQGYVFYRQNWSVLDDAEYGNEGFGLCGCGPTCVAAIISNLAGVPVDPEEMRVYGIKHGSWLPSGGTTFYFMTSTPARYGITATQIHTSDKDALFEALRCENKLVLATMGPGDFTLGAHFMLFRGVTDEGKILIADSYSFEHSVMEWDYEILYAQLKKSPGYWIFEMPKQ